MDTLKGEKLRVEKQVFARALRESGGVHAKAAQVLDIPRSAFGRALLRHPDLLAKYPVRPASATNAFSNLSPAERTAERTAFEQALEATNGWRVRAAILLGISVAAFQNRLAHHPQLLRKWPARRGRPPGTDTDPTNRRVRLRVALPKRKAPSRVPSRGDMENALRKASGNRTEASRILGMSLTGFRDALLRHPGVLKKWPPKRGRPLGARGSINLLPAVHHAERKSIEKALRSQRGNHRQAARSLGVSTEFLRHALARHPDILRRFPPKIGRPVEIGVIKARAAKVRRTKTKTKKKARARN